MNRQLHTALLALIACNSSSGATTTFDGATAGAIVAARAAVPADSFTQRIDAARISGDSTAKVWMIGQ